ncbi:hypothetical protein HYN59_05025 [Flavobacterium album]|uniref:DUF3800 domain-containing protein n=1 Tax=Flavobacterium album TaxID=2175091 RepID=A0A2S1QW17_9FLAO|nr:DUF3800 domain-containing protein [Flavobacterium album]AWH84519.1 hypothetical protein HYN59_05025 [Flavobacterium album]
MYIAYFDESGDDGYPKFSSQLFVLSAVYMHESDWKDNYDVIRKFRQYLKDKYDFPIKMEFHCRQLIQDKYPYHGKYSTEERKELIELHFKLIAALKLKVINVVIDKNRIKKEEYDVLKNAFTYSLQRIENDMAEGNDNRFIVITDEGRIKKMTSVARLLQRINYIPSLFDEGSYRNDLKTIIEDPLPKKSNESYFIQLSDTLAYIVNLYAQHKLVENPLSWPKRVQQVLKYGDDEGFLDILLEKGKLNTKANKNNKFGIVYYPK